MSNDLVKLYRELEHEKPSPELKKVLKNIEDKLYDKLREHFHEVLVIGSVIGYNKLETELSNASKLIVKLKKK